MKYKVWHLGHEKWIQDDWNVYIDPDGDVVEIDEGDYGIMYKNIIADSVKIVRYTGLKDRNGVEIYEGDLLEHDAEDNGVWKTYEATAVVYDDENAMFCFENDEGNMLTEYYKNFVVVGNIYESKEESQ